MTAHDIPRPKGRPTAERSEEIHRAIIDAARELIHQQGLGATTMEAIAVAARISKNTLYGRFSTKDEILRALVAEHVDSLTQATLERGIPMPADFKDRLRYIAHSIIDTMASEALRQFREMVAATRSLDRELSQAVHDTGHRHLIAQLTQEILDGTRCFPVPPRNPERVAEMLLSTLTGWYDAHSRVRDVSREEAITYADHYVDILFAGRSNW